MKLRKIKLSTAIRMLLMIAMIYGIYLETGIVTTIFVSLVAIYIEINDKHIDKIIEHNQVANEIFKKLIK